MPGCLVRIIDDKREGLPGYSARMKLKYSSETVLELKTFGLFCRRISMPALRAVASRLFENYNLRSKLIFKHRPFGPEDRRSEYRRYVDRMASVRRAVTANERSDNSEGRL